MLDKEDKDFGGVLSTAKTALTLYIAILWLRRTRRPAISPSMTS